MTEVNLAAPMAATKVEQTVAMKVVQTAAPLVDKKVVQMVEPMVGKTAALWGYLMAGYSADHSADHSDQT